MAQPTTVLPPDAHPSISPQTYYLRLKKGWSPERAKSQPIHRNPDSPFQGMDRGASRGFRLPKEWEEDYLKSVEESGLTASDWVAQVIGRELGKSMCPVLSGGILLPVRHTRQIDIK